MKKLGLLVMPLMAVSLLASCNNGGGDQPGGVKFSLSSDQPITVEDKSATVYVDWKPTSHSITFDSFTFETEQSEVSEITFDKESEARPMPVKITFKDEITEDINGTLNFAYEDATAKTTGENSIEVTIDVPEPEPTTKRWYEMPDWWNYCSNNKPVNEAKPEDVGRIVNVTVYGIVHEVRLIDVDHIGIAGETNCHCTFEFKNPIADSCWNVKGEGDNYNFPESTLNDLLNNDDDCIFKALPTGLQGKIRTVTKMVATTSSYNVTSYSTKLFPLAHDEMIGHIDGAPAANEGIIYKYYVGLDPDLSEQYPYYLLRSPDTSLNTCAWTSVSEEQTYIVASGAWIDYPIGVAPAFCI